MARARLHATRCSDARDLAPEGGADRPDECAILRTPDQLAVIAVVPSAAAGARRLTTPPVTRSLPVSLASTGVSKRLQARSVVWADSSAALAKRGVREVVGVLGLGQPENVLDFVHHERPPGQRTVATSSRPMAVAEIATIAFPMGPSTGRTSVRAHSLPERRSVASSGTTSTRTSTPHVSRKSVDDPSTASVGERETRARRHAPDRVTHHPDNGIVDTTGIQLPRDRAHLDQARGRPSCSARKRKLPLAATPDSAEGWDGRHQRTLGRPVPAHPGRSMAARSAQQAGPSPARASIHRTGLIDGRCRRRRWSTGTRSIARGDLVRSATGTPPAGRPTGPAPTRRGRQM